VSILKDQGNPRNLQEIQGESWCRWIKKRVEKGGKGTRPAPVRKRSILIREKSRKGNCGDLDGRKGRSPRRKNAEIRRGGARQDVLKSGRIRQRGADRGRILVH